jgi:hypothetical protein
MKLGRRGFIGFGLAGSASLICALAKADDGIAAPQSDLDRFIKVRGALDGRVVIGGVKGQYNGVVDGRTTPLFGVVSAVFSRYRPQADGYRIVEFEEAYYTDLETGKVLSQLKNPYTNEIVDVPAYNGPIDRVLITEGLKFHTDAPPPSNVQVRHFAEGPEISGGDIVFVERVSVSVAAAAGKPAFQYTDHTTLRASLSAVDKSTNKMVGSKTHFEATCSWRPWLKMGDRPGYLTASGEGGFGVKLTDLPAAWLNETANSRPELLSHLESRLQ